MTEFASFLLPVLVLLPVLGGLICWFAGTAAERGANGNHYSFSDGSHAGHPGAATRALVSWLVPTVELLLVVLLLLIGFRDEISFSFPAVCGLGLGFRADGLRWILCLMGSVLWFGSAVFGQEYLGHAEHKSRYYLYYLITEGATLGVFLSADLYTLLVCFEVMSVASWTLVAHEETPGAMRAADSYLAFAVIGGLVTLMGLFLLQDMFGTVNIAALQKLAPACEDRRPLYVAGALTAFGFCAKCGMWPLHTWLPAAHPVAPATASALLSGIITKAGIFGILVLSAQIFLHDAAWGAVILVFAMITMLTGAVLGVFSTNLKRTLACSSMSQIGFILTGVAMSELLGEENALAVHGLTLHMLNHSLFKLTLFLAAGAVFMNLHELELNKIRGFGRGKPILCIAMGCGLWGLAGIPGGSGYVSKTLLHESIVEYIELLEHAGRSAGWFRTAEWVFLISGGLTLAYMLKLFICLCVEKNSDAKEQTRFDSMNHCWCNRVSGSVLLGCALLIPLLGCTVYQTMDRLAALAEPFFRVEESHAVHYFTLVNLKGSAISVGIGLLVYLFFVRKALMKDGTYLNRWPKVLDLENLIYRPLLLKVLPFIGALAARTVGTLPELVRKGLCALLYHHNDNGYVYPKENDRFTVYEQMPVGTRGYGASLNFSLLMFTLGLVIVLVFLFLQ